jgi:23S rRNA (adenine-N6)-dimethyltransferase
VDSAGIGPGDYVIDLGAGQGALTAALVAAGARVLAVERHPGRVATLRRRFAHDPVQVLPIDLTQFRSPRRPFRVVASPPYQLGTRLVTALTQPASGLLRADLVLQRAAARRLAGTLPGRFQASLGPAVPRSAFRPPPRVDSIVLTIRRR